MTGTSTVLVVDDDADLRELTRFALEDAGYSVLDAPDGQVALDTLAIESVDLVLLDMRMPVMDGWTFARNYHRQSPPWVPVVVVTAARDGAQRAAEIGAENHLDKPFALDELLSIVQSLCSLNPSTDGVSGTSDVADTLTFADSADGESNRLPQPDSQVQASRALTSTAADRVNASAPSVYSVSVLLVDDRPRNIVALQAALASVDCNLVTACSGVEALKCLLLQEFAAIVLDVQMPGMDGFEAARFIRQREQSQSTPIIFLTAEDHELAHAREGYLLGAVDYITKPFQASELRAKVALFVELFRQSLVLAQRTAELSQVTADELLVVNDRLAGARVDAQEQAEKQISLKGAAADAIRRRDELMSIAEHEMRTPVAAIKTSAQLMLRALEDGTPDKDGGMRHLCSIVGGADRLTVLLDDLMDASRMRSGGLPLSTTPLYLADARRALD